MASFEHVSESQDYPLQVFSNGGFAEAQTIASHDKDSNSGYHVSTLNSGGSWTCDSESTGCH